MNDFCEAPKRVSVSDNEVMLEKSGLREGIEGDRGMRRIGCWVRRLLALGSRSSAGGRFCVTNSDSEGLRSIAGGVEAGEGSVEDLVFLFLSLTRGASSGSLSCSRPRPEPSEVWETIFDEGFRSLRATSPDIDPALGLRFDVLSRLTGSELKNEAFSERIEGVLAWTWTSWF